MSCAYRIKSPSSRFVTSEAQGKLWAGGVTANRVGATSATMHVTSNEVKKDLEIEPSWELGANAFLGVAEKVDLTLNTGLGSITTVGVKYQILGESRLKAKKGNFSWAVAAFSGYAEEKNADDDLLDIYGNTKVDYNRTSAEGQTIVGYRLLDELLGYALLSYASYQMEGNVRSDRAAINGATFNYNGGVTTTGIGMGYYKNRLILQLELALQKAKWDNSVSHTYGFVNTAVGFVF